MQIGYGQSLRYLEASTIHANIASSGTNGRQIRRIVTTGAFNGSIDCYTLDDPSTSGPSGLSVGGQLNANVNVVQSGVENISMSSLASGKTIKLGSSYAKDITISSASGLAGQIILNADATSESWTGVLSVGGSTVSGTPYYTATNLGGGAAGLVRFAYHPLESHPDDNSSLDLANVPNPVEVWWYGPLTAESSTPVRVFSRKGCGGMASYRDDTSLFSYSVDSNNRRRLLISPGLGGWEFGREYKVVPKTTESGDTGNRLMCADLLPGASASVKHYPDDNANPYSFCINPDIGMLMAALGGRTLPEALAAWDAQPWDADRDGIVNFEDRAFLIYAAEYLANHR